MLTHDLKNAIEGLSLTVSNMERHFDNEQFRIDAMKGLTNATDKLRAIVARLSRPVSSLSGEHKRPTKTDLIPILKRVMAMTAEPMRGRHTIQTKLPANLFALADAQRVEEVMENLILNALEAMHDRSGTLTIEAGPDENGAPSFSVSDTGPGMTRTFIETRLFRPVLHHQKEWHRPRSLHLPRSNPGQRRLHRRAIRRRRWNDLSRRATIDSTRRA